MDASLAALISLLGPALFEAAKTLAEKGLIDPALDKGLEPFKKRLTARYDKAKAEAALRAAFVQALKDAGAPAEDERSLAAYCEKTRLARLADPRASLLRQEAAQAIMGYTDPQAAPPAELIQALGWPPGREAELGRILTRLRQELARLEAWRPLVEYADRLDQLGVLRRQLDSLARLENTLLHTSRGDALRVVVVASGLSPDQAEVIEQRYRQGLRDEFRWLDTRGLSPAQLPKSIRLPLEEVYTELALLPMRSSRDRDEELQAMLETGEPDRLARETRRQDQRVAEALAEHQRLVIVGKPGSGKTVSLRFVTLMLALGRPGAGRLGLAAPYLPLYVRLAQYAEKLKADSTLALETFLLRYIEDNYPGAPQQGCYLQMALEKGACLVLLDGLDEVGDIGDSLLHGKTLRETVLEQARRFADRRCADHSANRIVVTSRLEGYHSGDLPGFAETELSALAVPGEVEDFLMRWFSAYEQEYTPTLPLVEARRKAQARVGALMKDILRSESVQRLAMNPLLLTILAMIYEKGTHLPERRVELYDTVTRTMIESWREAQTKHVSSIHEVIPTPKIRKLLKSLAYWLHENRPGGAMPEADWRVEIRRLLDDADDDDEDMPGSRRQTADLVEMFLRHAREEVGLLTERSAGQIGFFHLTLEEYLAAEEIACQETDQRAAMLARHWRNPRWHEVILLAAGQLMLTGSPGLDTFISELRTMESDDPGLAGYPAILAGRAIVDVGVENFKKKVARDVRQDLLAVMQDLDPETRQPYPAAHTVLATRAAAADTLDALGWLPADLHTFIPIPPEGFWIGQYPVTNAQYERFLNAPDFGERTWWVDYPQFDENSRAMTSGWGDKGWDWLQEALQDKDRSPDGKRVQPRNWDEPRYGLVRRGVPVVGITWYEANAYCQWLRAHWGELEEGKANPGLRPAVVRLPTEAEWVAAAGGAQPKARFPWDEVGQATQERDEILRRANLERAIGRTTPVGMYAQGVSRPHGVWDLGGNVWEWQANYSDKDHDVLALRGGSWNNDIGSARLSGRDFDRPDYEWSGFGFRVLASPSLG